MLIAIWHIKFLSSQTFGGCEKGLRWDLHREKAFNEQFYRLEGIRNVFQRLFRRIREKVGFVKSKPHLEWNELFRNSNDENYINKFRDVFK
jgi:hypothetical protein